MEPLNHRGILIENVQVTTKKDLSSHPDKQLKAPFVGFFVFTSSERGLIHTKDVPFFISKPLLANG